MKLIFNLIGQTFHWSLFNLPTHAFHALFASQSSKMQKKTKPQYSKEFR